MAVVRSADFELLASDSVDTLIDSLRGGTAACVVVGGSRFDRYMDKILQLGSERNHVACVLVCDRASGREVRRALARGFDGVVFSEDLEVALESVVIAVCAGQVSVPRESREQMRPPSLTTREKQILGLVVMGLTNGEIASKLFLAESTVKSHLSSAFAKLDVSSRNEAVGLILDPERGRGLGILSIPAEPVVSATSR
jgi:DNA-binding NarL/FixJ family response regulator